MIFDGFALFEKDLDKRYVLPFSDNKAAMKYPVLC